MIAVFIASCYCFLVGFILSFLYFWTFLVKFDVMKYDNMTLAALEILSVMEIGIPFKVQLFEM